MASKTIIDLTDDLDGTPAQHTVRFSLEDSVYEIDLNSTNRAKLSQALAPFAAAARRVRGDSAHSAHTPVDPRAVREWARSRGIAVPARSRVPNSVIEQFRAAGN